MSDEVVQNRPSRRRVLGLCGAVVAAVAGCSEESGEGTEGDGSGGDGSGGGASDGGASDGSNGGTGGSSDGGTGGDGGDGSGESTEDPVDAGDGTAGEPGGTEAGAEAETESDTETPVETETAAGEDTETATGRPKLNEATEFTSSFAMELTMEAENRIVLTGRFHEGDLYWEYDLQGREAEWYLVDGTSYHVVDGQCYTGTFNQQLDEDDVDPQDFEEQAEDHPDIEPAGTDEIDGQEVLVYEFDGEAGEVTYYVLAEKGYLRRVEAEGATWDFHSWGEVDPVEKPDMDCQDVSGG